MKRAPIRVWLPTLLLVFAVPGCGGEELTGFVQDPAPSVMGVTLPDAARGGRDYTLTAEKGELLLVYFGYTSCPDVCPTTLADLRRAVADLGDEADRVEVAVVTVDPDRDDAEVISAYVQAFFPDGHALRTDDPDRLAHAAESYSAFYEVTELDDGTIDVAHSSLTYVVDSTAHVPLIWPFGVASDDLAKDLRILLKAQTSDL